MTQAPLPKHDPKDPWPATVTPIHASGKARERARRDERATRRDDASRDASRARVRRLTPSESRLSRWLRDHDIHGTDNIIADYGMWEVVEVLHDEGIVILQENPYDRWAQAGHAHKRQQTWTINPKWTNAGGMLVYLLRKKYGPR